MLDFGEGFVVIDAIFESFAKADGFAEVDPVGFVDIGHFGDAGFATALEKVVPDAGDGFVIIVPEFAFVFGAISAQSRIAGVDGGGFAVFVEKVREANFEQNVVFGEIFLEFLFVLDDSVFESNTIRADKVGIDDEIIFGVEIADGHLFVPDHFGVAGFAGGAGNNSSDK